MEAEQNNHRLTQTQSKLSLKWKLCPLKSELRETEHKQSYGSCHIVQPKFFAFISVITYDFIISSISNYHGEVNFNVGPL